MNHEVEVQNHSASYYETRYTGYGKRYHQQIIQQLLQGAKGRILDAGCGTGFVSECAPELNIVGIDLSPGMLKYYRGKTCHLMDVCQLPRNWENHFDAVICRSLLHHLPDHLQGLSEMHRVMKSGAKISFWEPSRSLLAKEIRKHTQHGDRFSEYHHSFTDRELACDINKWFIIEDIQYIGFFAYPLYGFRDIIDFQGYLPFNFILYPVVTKLDLFLSHIPVVKYLSWSILIRGKKV